ncbi:hypothetical protein Patl1_07029 [Pistacia atlantica]|uniref:Uncharacterized protein n=1 Tax=Pistacia atlantica TaxID=434234 RepID=A0ACC1AIK1_9ROSI|nr:hypothetical protein Patl1_07029 [Pistacia atlantica]
MTIVPSNSTQRLLSFHNLETLTVMHCWNMKSLFPVSTATGLLQLKQLKMISCGLEEIVAKEEVDETPRFLFPQLTFLMLANLPELKCFYLGLHTTEWPMLESLGVFHCEKIKIFASEFPRDQNTDQDSQPSFDLSGKAMPSLESLYLDVSHVRQMCHNHIPFEGFCQLKELFLAKLDDESIQFFYGFLKSYWRILYLERKPVQAALDDDIQRMNKIQMEVRGNETAMIVLGFQQEGYPQRGLTILVLLQVRRMASTGT